MLQIGSRVMLCDRKPTSAAVFTKSFRLHAIKMYAFAFRNFYRGSLLSDACMLMNEP